MKDGFIRVAAATPAVKVADCVYNKEQILAYIQQAQEQQVKVLIFPELCLTGYTCGDLFLQDALIGAAEQALLEIAEQTRGIEMLLMIGLPVRKGTALYDCAAVLYEGEILGIVPKRELPDYAEFSDGRWFTPAPEVLSEVKLGERYIPFGTNLLFGCAQIPALCVAAEIGTDLWAMVPPSVGHTCAGATIVANLSASDELVGKGDYRRLLVQAQSAKTVSGYIYCEAGTGESTTDMVFAGHNMIGENGVLLKEAVPFRNELICTEIDVNKLYGERRKMHMTGNMEDEYLLLEFDMQLQKTPLSRTVEGKPFAPKESETERIKRCEGIFAIQVNGLKQRMAHIHAKTAVIGISGGLDSCLALLVTVKAMDALQRDRRDILAVTMPCFGTTSRTKSNAQVLCELLGVSFETVEISKSVLQHLEDIKHPVDVYDAAYENAQARERTQVLMDLANKTGGIVIGTGDLSELALGWATYNGDHMSMYGVNASIPKTLVQYLVDYEADTCGDDRMRTVLKDILSTPISPELLPAEENEIAQKTEDLVGPYELHDFCIYQMMRYGFAPDKIYRLAKEAFAGIFDDATILKWMKVFYRRFFSQQFKRSCLPDGPKVGAVGLSPRGDWRMPSDANARIWQQVLENL